MPLRAKNGSINRNFINGSIVHFRSSTDLGPTGVTFSSTSTSPHRTAPSDLDEMAAAMKQVGQEMSEEEVKALVNKVNSIIKSALSLIVQVQG